MNEVVIAFFALLVTAALIGVGVLYLRYRTTPAAVWKRRVRAAVREQEDRRRMAQRDLSAARDEIGARVLRQEFLAVQLRGQSVEELASYPGIGPVTVARLRDAGLTTIEDCGRVRLSNIPGIGPSRQADLKGAVQKARLDAEARFNAGASPEAVAYAQEVKRREALHLSRRQAAEQTIREAGAALVFLSEPNRVALKVTFLRHLFGYRPIELTVELMGRSLSPPTAPEQLRSPSPPASGGDGERVDLARRAERRQPPDQARIGPLTGLPLAQEPPKRGEREEVTPVAHAPGSPTPMAEPTPLDRLRAAAGFGLAVAKSDGRIANSERRQVRVFLERRYARSADLVNQLDAVLADIENDLPTIGDVLWDIRRLIPAAEWPDLFQFAQSVADAAGERNAREVQCLARIAEELGIGPVVAPTTTDRLRAPPAPAETPPAGDETVGAPATRGPGEEPLSDPECRAALEIGPETPLSVDLIRRQYRLLTERFVPEKFTSHGPDFVRMAAERWARVERAARHLVAEYNEPLVPPDATPPPADPRHNPDLDAALGLG
ncbi:MAG TPA: TerB family tellurite resistance protein [Gemmataceae bacterium]|nr:TerB family tellurite resistance protein [Gemmataceae bacterium]